MIKELLPSEFSLCTNLLNLDGQIEVVAIVKGLAPGRVFVDNTESPQTAMVWQGNNDGFFFIGNENNQLFNSNINSFIDLFIKEQAKAVGLNCFECIGNDSKWNNVIEKLFEHRKLTSWDQYIFELNCINQKELTLNHDVEVLSVHNILSDNSKTYINTEFARSKVLEFWTSLEDFYSTGIGFCTIEDDVIVSICFSGYVVDAVHCVGIETLEEYRGKGLALAALNAFVAECQLQHCSLYWDCMKTNTPSVKLARRIGCELKMEYKGYYFNFD